MSPTYALLEKRRKLYIRLVYVDKNIGMYKTNNQPIPQSLLDYKEYLQSRIKSIKEEINKEWYDKIH